MKVHGRKAEIKMVFIYLDDLGRMQIGGQPLVDLEDLLRVPNHSLQITREHNSGAAHWEDATNVFSVALQLLPFFLQI